MAGKRHHFVPRFIQAGFASHTKNKDSFTWVYRKGAKAFNTNIVNIGLEGQFYDLDGDNQVDDQITNLEGRFSDFYNALRRGEPEAVANSDTIGELIAHLEVRTRHLRQNFTITASKFMDELLRFVSDEQAFGNYIKRKISRDPMLLRSIIAEELRKHQNVDLKLEEAYSALSPLFEQEQRLDLGGLSEMVESFKAAIPQMIETAHKSGHIKGLRQTLAPPVKANIYKTFTYRLLDTKDVSLPLGDSILVFEIKGQKRFKSVTEKDDDVQAIYLPLTSTCTLVGNNDGNILGIEELPMVIAQCSLEYFISNNNSDTNDLLHNSIGEYAQLLSNKEIETLIAEIQAD